MPCSALLPTSQTPQKWIVTFGCFGHTSHHITKAAAAPQAPMTSDVLLVIAVSRQIPEGIYTSHPISPVSLACRRPRLWCQAIQAMSGSKITFVLLFYWDILIWFWGNPWEHRRQCCNFPQMGLKRISFPSKSNDPLIKKWSLCSPTPTAAPSTISSRMKITVQQCHCTPGNLIPQSFLSRTELNCCRLALGIEKPESSTVPEVVNCKNNLIRQK